MSKKNLLIYLFFIFVIMIVPVKVKGIELCDSDYKYACSSCEYKYSDGITFYFYAREDRNGNVTISYDDVGRNTTNYNYTINNRALEPNYYLNSEKTKLTCPKYLYVKKTQQNPQGASGITGTSKGKIIYNLSFDKTSNDGSEATAEVVPYVNNKSLNSSTETEDKKKRVCSFNAKLLDSSFNDTGQTLHVIFEVGDSLPSRATINGVNYSLSFSGFTPSDFGSSNKCEVNKDVYVVCNQGNESSGVVGPNSGANTVKAGCTISSTQIYNSEKADIEDVPTGGSLGGDDYVDDGDGNTGSIDFGDEITTEDCQAILGSTLDIINTVFNWIKIIAPILVIVFGSFDFAGAVLQDNQEALKKATSKFVKRVIAAVIIFFLPLIINLILSLPGVNSGLEEALCGISKVVIRW